jgi:phage tail P2-like protein
MKSILPPNRTPLELGLEKTIRQPLDFPNRDLWNADKCPENLLPYLAWSLSVDSWDDSWPEQKKREVIKNTVFIENTRGTRSAVERITELLTEHGAKVIEWFEDPTRLGIGEFKIAITAGTQPVNFLDFQALLPRIQIEKNVRSYFVGFELLLRTDPPLKIATADRLIPTVTAGVWEHHGEIRIRSHVPMKIPVVGRMDIVIRSAAWTP